MTGAAGGAVAAGGAAAGVTVLDAADNGPVPTGLTAATWKLYAVPLVSPVTMAVPTFPVTGTVLTSVVPLDTWTLYPLIAEPPLLAAGTVVQFTVAWPSPAAAVPTTGAAVGAVAAGGAATVAGRDGVDSGPVTVPATEATVKVTEPAGSPVTVTGEVLPMPICPVLAVTRKPVTAKAPAGGRVKATDAEFPVTVAMTLVGAAGPATGVPGAATVESLNFNCSMLNSVSKPSLLDTTPATGGVTVVLSSTVTDPLSLVMTLYWDSGPAKVAVSQFFAAAPAAQSAGVAALSTLFTISRTLTRLPGSTMPAKTACWRVMPVVPGPKSPDVALFSIRSVRPVSVAGSAGFVRTLMAVRSSWSPSMISSPARPVNVSLPGPPSRMSPSPQTGPASGHRPAADSELVSSAVPSHWSTGGSRAARPLIRATPAASRASQPETPPVRPSISRGVARTPSVPDRVSLPAVPESASVSCHRSRLTTSWIGSPPRLLLI